MTREQIEAAAREKSLQPKIDADYWPHNDHEMKAFRLRFAECALWMRAQLEGSILRLERAAWEAARTYNYTYDGLVEMKDERYRTFEDWKKQNAK